MMTRMHFNAALTSILSPLFFIIGKLGSLCITKWSYLHRVIILFDTYRLPVPNGLSIVSTCPTYPTVHTFSTIAAGSGKNSYLIK
jgi:hypothetical protein